MEFLIVCGFAFAAFTIIAVVLVTPLMYIENIIEAKQCKETAAVMKVEHSYSFWTPCMVKYRGEWVPLKSVQLEKNVE